MPGGPGSRELWLAEGLHAAITARAVLAPVAERLQRGPRRGGLGGPYLGPGRLDLSGPAAASARRVDALVQELMG
jgi:hypothetical protein